jgi:hypothetical protein
MVSRTEAEKGVNTESCLKTAEMCNTYLLDSQTLVCAALNYFLTSPSVYAIFSQRFRKYLLLTAAKALDFAGSVDTIPYSLFYKKRKKLEVV